MAGRREKVGHEVKKKPLLSKKEKRQKKRGTQRGSRRTWPGVELASRPRVVLRRTRLLR